MVRAKLEPINGGLGTEPPAGSRGRAPEPLVRGSGAKPSAAERLFVLSQPEGLS